MATPNIKMSEILNQFTLNFLDKDIEQLYHIYSSKFTLRSFTYFFIYAILAIFIAIIKNILALNYMQQLKNVGRLFFLTIYYFIIRHFGDKNKFILDLGFIFLIVSLYMIHLFHFFPHIFESFPGVNSYYLGSAIESLRIFLFISKADWKLVLIGNMTMNFFNAYECLLLPNLTKDNIFAFLFPFLMVNTFPIFSYFYERNTRQIFYENLLYQKTLESYEYLIKNAFPNQILILNADKDELLFCNEATKNFFATKDPNEIFNEIKAIHLQSSHNNGISDLSKENQNSSKDFYSIVRNYDENHSKELKFMGYEGYLYRASANNEKPSGTRDIYSEFSFDIKLGKIRWKNKSAFLLILTDISPLKLIQKLKEIDSYKDMLLATVSHDLRTPLNCLMGMLDLIYERIFDKKTRKYIKMALRSANLLLFMINDILDYSQITNNKFSLNNRTHQLSDIINEVVDLIKFQCKKKKDFFCVGRFLRNTQN